jgi:hypothetical protein
MTKSSRRSLRVPCRALHPLRRDVIHKRMVPGAPAQGAIALAAAQRVGLALPSSPTLVRALKASTTGPGTKRDPYGSTWWRKRVRASNAPHSSGRRLRVTSRVTGEPAGSGPRQRAGAAARSSIPYVDRPRVARPADRSGGSNDHPPDGRAAGGRTGRGRWPRPGTLQLWRVRPTPSASGARHPWHRGHWRSRGRASPDRDRE